METEIKVGQKWCIRLVPTQEWTVVGYNQPAGIVRIKHPVTSVYQHPESDFRQSYEYITAELESLEAQRREIVGGEPEIKVGDYWKSKDGTEYRIVAESDFRQSYEYITTELESLEAQRREIVGGTMEPTGIADDKQLHLWTADAASLAADMLSELGYTFDGQCWTAPTADPLTTLTLRVDASEGFAALQAGIDGIRKKPPAAHDLLDAAAGHMRDRAATYDKPEGERSMAATVQAFNAQTGRDLTEAEGWLLMVNLKIVRDRQRYQPHRDSVEDLVAYGALYGEARLGGAA